ncbi:aminoglycoside phosphotransferase [Kribbella flavida DSM 17836]|uniref:Aminoglycoside phosphotransferase n=1 Tax=Kribbella flavida (strain DSM 17836 / JCM 10339 / NBRC 14399) TaxID=479435 RepID=D2Q469_KRIFD|nr:aminoglycoside phosphotransferase APH(3') [Kribbella flavida]ADB30383.1 aminoglycoside phosphotransferase [Kribbella flavida DSM 17836]
MDVETLAARFSARNAEPVLVGHSGATVVRLRRGAETLYYKEDPAVGADADRLVWLSGTGFPCPRVLDRGDGWMLTSELPGRDASQPWPAADRPHVLAAIAAGLRELHALPPDCPFRSPFPGSAQVVTHGDYAAPNVFVDPDTLRFAGVLDISRLGLGDRYVDIALMVKSLSGRLNPQYGGPPAARTFATAYGADPDDPRIPYYTALDDSGDF